MQTFDSTPFKLGEWPSSLTRDAVFVSNRRMALIHDKQCNVCAIASGLAFDIASDDKVPLRSHRMSDDER